MIVVHVLNGARVMATSLAVTLDVLQTANRVCDQLGKALVFDVRCGDAEALRLAPSPDCLIIPGLGLVSRAEIEAELACDDAKRAVAAIGSAQGLVAASCASTFLVAEAGRLDGRRATTSWFLAPTFAQRYPDVCLQADAVVVEDGQIVTGGAAMAQMDVMLRVTTRFAGPDVSGLCARYLLADERRSQAGYVALRALTAADPRLAMAEQWILDHLPRGEIAVDDIARVAGLHPKTFYRRLLAATRLSPSRFVQRLRLEAASDLLQDTTLSVEEIAARVGYADASTLRRMVRRDLHMSASEIRARSRPEEGR